MKTLKQLHGNSSGRAQISLTPLIDVVFILLIFFMLASNFQKERNIELTTPESAEGSSASQQEAPVRITIMGGGMFDKDGEILNSAELSQAFDQKKDAIYIVGAGSEAAVQDVVGFMDLAAAHQVTKIRLSPDQKEK